MLTSSNPKLEQQIANTPEGMAYWADTGPFGRKCGECVFYNTKRRGGARCLKYSMMMNGRIARKLLPSYTLACKYFEEGNQNG